MKERRKLEEGTREEMRKMTASEETTQTNESIQKIKMTQKHMQGFELKSKICPSQWNTAKE